ncbi:MAG TPA: non-homologous end-joining DNA ligase [Kofleriaceae bacterium]|nr:non-homologous end-joining DNA ligase [Kofleriaceae bacterium]
MATASAAKKLAKYRSMRDFAHTAEPSGAAPRAHAKRAHGHSFVIQAHAARRMHYDFRLELDGVLLSWSVPKGPSLSPRQRRLAVRTEDHPLDYASFEGIIPQGQYGGGTVVVWDRGTWEPEGDAHQAMAKGRLTFTLHGEKLHGRWHLVKTKGDGKAESWLLFKGRDEAANDKLDIVAEQPASVISGRTLDEVAEAPARVWKSNRAEKAKPPANINRTPGELVAQLPLGFKLTNLDKPLYPKGKHAITKGDLIAYLAVAADWMLPHLARRPLTLVRCPEGLAAIAPRGKSARGKLCFFQKHILPGSPSAIGRVPIEEDDGEISQYMQVHDMPGIVALAQLGTLEIHTWGSHADHVEQPDLLVFDLDPDVGLGWQAVALAAFDLRRRLGALGLESFVKTTGGKGLHVVVPIKRSIDWDECKAFCKALAEQMEREAPELYTSNMAKAKRKGKIFVDYLRNGRGATFIAPYSPRARPGAPVAVPITWDELAAGVDPAAFTVETVPRRLAQLAEDPWRAIHDVEQKITARAWRAVGRGDHS